MTIATPLRGFVSVIGQLRGQAPRTETDMAEQQGAMASRSETPIRFESWRIVRWDDETLWLSPSPPTCVRSPIAAQRTSRNQRGQFGVPSRSA